MDAAPNRNMDAAKHVRVMKGTVDSPKLKLQHYYLQPEHKIDKESGKILRSIKSEIMRGSDEFFVFLEADAILLHELLHDGMVRCVQFGHGSVKHEFTFVQERHSVSDFFGAVGDIV